MTNTSFSLHKSVVMVAAVAMTVAVQGSLLFGVNQMADASQTSTVAANARTVTLPTVNVTHARA